MPAKKTSRASQKKTIAQPKKTGALPKRASGFSWLRLRFERTRRRVQEFLIRRPHRSFRRTRRRDYVRSLDIPGYFSFTKSVLRVLWQHKKTYVLMIIAVALASAFLSSVASQSTFSELATTLRDTSKNIFSGGWGELGKAGLLLVVGVNGTLAGSPTDVQKVYGVLILLFTWLVTVWLLRAQLAGKNPRLRDGLYSAGAPIVSTFCLVLLFALQLVPAAIAAIAISTVVGSDLIHNGFLSMIFYLVCLLLALVSVYLIVSTFFALVIVTLPGMYPWQALKTAGDLVIGRRLRVLLRLGWAALVIVLVWVVIMIPLIIFVTWLQATFTWSSWIPIVPTALTLLSSTTVVFAASYIYMLYRGMIEDDSAPA